MPRIKTNPETVNLHEWWTRTLNANEMSALAGGAVRNLLIRSSRGEFPSPWKACSRWYWSGPDVAIMNPHLLPPEVRQKFKNAMAGEGEA